MSEFVKKLFGVKINRPYSLLHCGVSNFEYELF